MKIQCNACESAEARVLCCADEAALCWSCDDKVHAANKLASKHQRVSLSASSSPMPKCDICQETVGYFFCLEDRALLCRKCDISIHTANAYVSAHRRFLLTGVKVGLEPINPAASASSGNSHSVKKAVEKESPPISSNALCNDLLPVRPSGVEDFAPGILPLVGGATAGIIPQWQFDELLGMGDFNQNYGYMECGSSKADDGMVGESDSSPILRDAEVEGDECLVEVPETCWDVPRIPSPPTASGLYWPAKNLQNPFDSAVLESVVSCSSMQNFQHQQSNGSGKRRRAV
ncbi:PREDICTED: B-box zinc finger protein 22-like [Nicotiana attenuata]|uniref:B-box zinc finger protein 22 n=1 Tax=Nicotiana attenuata TaxID=49451 RepID=A0A1J6JYD4_NICAT|nr:PREDICTED: B-box zinc finger protein 22-like [Nicotiana attenuata]OIT21460.1 b-box zinc finger protein 22 [Nicotiana attenuata]